MKLERFEKNKKKKVYIVLSITVVLLVSVFVLYKSFALYEEIKEFNVINGVIPDFNKSDIKLAYTINGKQSNEAFPSKEDNYQVKRVECDKGVTASWNSELWGLVDINSNGNKTISCTVNFNNKEPICKRAATLHTEICNRDLGCIKNGIDAWDTKYSKGDTITYGQIGTSGILNLGDAFDCDVNGDGNYSERFYYVTDLEGYNDTAVLIYYNNYGKAVLYDENLNTNPNGPATAINELPTINEWSNISLKQSIRKIYNTYDDTTSNVPVINFSYEKYAARLGNFNNLNRLCADSTKQPSNLLTYKCEFLLENTFDDSSNSYWLEPSDDMWYLSIIDSALIDSDHTYSENKYFVRPVIEIDKSDMVY